jgi:hypothetical protein
MDLCPATFVLYPRQGRDAKLLAAVGCFRPQRKADSSPLTRIRNDKGFGAVMAGLKACRSAVLLNFPDANRAFGGVRSPTLTSQKARRLEWAAPAVIVAPPKCIDPSLGSFAVAKDPLPQDDKELAVSVHFVHITSQEGTSQ